MHLQMRWSKWGDTLCKKESAVLSAFVTPAPPYTQTQTRVPHDNQPSHRSAKSDVKAVIFLNPLAQVPLANCVSDALEQVYWAPTSALVIGVQSVEQFGGKNIDARIIYR